MDEWVDESAENEWIGGWTNDWWMNWRMNECRDEWMDEMNDWIIHVASFAPWESSMFYSLLSEGGPELSSLLRQSFPLITRLISLVHSSSCVTSPSLLTSSSQAIVANINKTDVFVSVVSIIKTGVFRWQLYEQRSNGMSEGLNEEVK